MSTKNYRKIFLLLRDPWLELCQELDFQTLVENLSFLKIAISENDNMTNYHTKNAKYMVQFEGN